MKTALLFFASAFLAGLSTASAQGLFYPLSGPLNGQWTHYSIPLTNTSEWRIGGPEGTEPTPAEFLDIIRAIDSLTIRFEASSTQVWLDNVSLAGLVTSRFLNTDDGWTIRDHGAPSQSILFGNPPGAINNGSLLAVFDAPAAYHGDFRDAFGGVLTFDAVGSGGPPVNQGYVVLTAVPEPNASALCILGMILLLTVARHKSRLPHNHDAT